MALLVETRYHKEHEVTRASSRKAADIKVTAEVRES